MKSFKLIHLVFGHQEMAQEDAMPAWLTRHENKWFMDAHVVTLEVGDHVDTSFWRIERAS